MNTWTHLDPGTYVSPLPAQRLVRLLRLLLRLEAKVFDVDAEALVQPLEETVGQSLLLFV